MAVEIKPVFQLQYALFAVIGLLYMEAPFSQQIAQKFYKKEIVIDN